MRYYTTADSSNIHSVGYDKEAQQLGVIFKSGASYLYKFVRLDQFTELLTAPSLGKALLLIKGAGPDAHPYVRLDDVKLDHTASVSASDHSIALARIAALESQLELANKKLEAYGTKLEVGQ